MATKKTNSSAAVLKILRPEHKEIWKQARIGAAVSGKSIPDYVFESLASEFENSVDTTIYFTEKDAKAELEKMGYTVKHRLGRWLRLGKLEGIGYKGSVNVYNFSKLVKFVEDNPQLFRTYNKRAKATA